MRHIGKIIIHCSATRPGWMSANTPEEKTAEIRRWHVEDHGWSDIGYHYVIDRDGTIVPGRPVERIGAHTRGHNRHSIGVCLIGGHGSASTDHFRDNFTPEQEAALSGILQDFSRDLPDFLTVHGHNEFAPKACPGFDVQKWIKSAPVVEAANDPAPPNVCETCGKAVAVNAPDPAPVAAETADAPKPEHQRRRVRKYW